MAGLCRSLLLLYSSVSIFFNKNCVQMASDTGPSGQSSLKGLYTGRGDLFI